MKALRIFLTVGVFLFLSSASGITQECVDYHEVGDCMLDRQRGFKVYSQSKSVSMGLTDTVELNIVFYGQKDYILSFCAHRKMYPVHFVLIDPDTESILYDNANDKYIESLGVGFDVTKSLKMRVDVLARESTEDEITDFLGCLGLLIQYKNYDKRKVNLKVQ
jgi:hypothetical protein